MSTCMCNLYVHVLLYGDLYGIWNAVGRFDRELFNMLSDYLDVYIFVSVQSNKGNEDKTI